MITHHAIDVATIIALIVLYVALFRIGSPSFYAKLASVDPLFTWVERWFGPGRGGAYFLILLAISVIAALLAPHPAYNIALVLPVGAFLLIAALPTTGNRA